MSSTGHILGYSKSARAKCHGPAPCKNSLLRPGTLRYGLVSNDGINETVEWRHWGCITPTILDQIALATVVRVEGFKDLSPSDQQKVRIAVSLRRIDPSDVPDTAERRPLGHGVGTASASGILKRKAGAVPASAAPTFSPETRRVMIPEEEVATVPGEEAQDELYGFMQTEVVGIRHYRGLVGSGEEVLLVREPQNPYDRNAIQVKNISRVQVGHLSRQIAAGLSPLLDQRLITLEGVIVKGNLSGALGYTLSITLKIYGNPENRDDVLLKLPYQVRTSAKALAASSAAASASASANAGAPSVTGGRALISSTSMPASRNGASAAARISAASQARNTGATHAQLEAMRKQQEAVRRAAELQQMLNSLEKVNDEGRRNSLLDTLCSNDDILNLPVHPNPPGIQSGDLLVDLLKHQSQALQWCIEKENPVLPTKETDRPVQFWQLKKDGGKSFYFNVATKTPQQTPPALGKGALCGDAMGLGKTLTMISLIMATKSENTPGFSKSTLIVAPVSILSNWEKQISDHCVSGRLSTYLYHGNSRSIAAAELQKYDIVITTYQTITGEHSVYDGDATGPSKKKKKVERSLFDVPWKRVILDEGHIIRNPKTKMAQSVVALNADKRWVLTGTPIINSPRDLGSMLTFLKICQPLDGEDFFKRLLLRPLKNGEPSGAELLRALMSNICIRRTKEMQDANGDPLIPLPPVEMIRVPVALDDGARRLYDEIETVSRSRVERILSSAGPAIMQSNVLSMLTRLRQLVLHPGLLPANYLEELRAPDAYQSASCSDQPQPSITLEEKLRLQATLGQAIEDCEECPICFSLLDDARITRCAHTFCIGCIMEVIQRDAKCPMDRRPLAAADLFERLPPMEFTQAPRTAREEAPSDKCESSAKIDQLVQLLQLIPGDQKSLVFSQFTSFLDKVVEALDKAGVSFVRFDGRMSARRRQEAIEKFSVPIQCIDEVPVGRRMSRSSRASTSSKSSSHADEDADSDEDYMPVDDQVNEAYEFPISAENPRVMLISLKAGALGLNLTVANNVFLMDPWWQEGIESQAIDRVNRIGQKKPVHVYQLIAEDTVESKVLEIQDRKKLLIKQAFSGIKNKETQRQQKEARLQDLIELFGARRQNDQGEASTSSAAK